MGLTFARFCEFLNCAQVYISGHGLSPPICYFHPELPAFPFPFGTSFPFSFGEPGCAASSHSASNHTSACFAISSVSMESGLCLMCPTQPRVAAFTFGSMLKLSDLGIISC